MAVTVTRAMGGTSSSGRVSSMEENKRDWIQLLLAPLLIGINGAALAAWFNAQQNERQIAIEDRRAEEARHVEEERAYARGSVLYAGCHGG